LPYPRRLLSPPGGAEVVTVTQSEAFDIVDEVDAGDPGVGAEATALVLWPAYGQRDTFEVLLRHPGNSVGLLLSTYDDWLEVLAGADVSDLEVEEAWMGWPDDDELDR